ncbi:hypothetical protein N7517_009575 [Penicillium concentricum]|uniref:Uncharacterized protein n=1 Tax=Penicillium concentricum TaxID=293559 RepID=A0A9W9UXK8_9EURO|nr:uncharacterized protein N7517_009575 [Penicillium concentricum]KAJ5360384.1 hypothetical protein N7517_009575 [Penicillium concentricum]
MPVISRQPTRYSVDELDAMPLLGRNPILQRDQPTLRLRFQQRCLKPETWWTSLTAFGAYDDISHMLEREKAIATEETRQEWMRRLRPMPHRLSPPVKQGKQHKRS